MRDVLLVESGKLMRDHEKAVAVNHHSPPAQDVSIHSQATEEGRNKYKLEI